MMGSPNRSSSWLNWAQAPREQGGLGLAPHQAAGIVGNLVHESGQDLNPWGPTGDNGTAWGTAQWRGDRLARLKARPDYQTVEGQQAFMREELDGSENKAYKALLAAKTPEEAAHAWDANYERSDGSTREQRMRSARDLMSQFGGDTSYQPGALTSSYTAPTESKKSMPAALSADNTMGQGVLASDYAGADPIAQGLIGIGASLASISNPDQAKALAAQQAALQKQAIDKGTWSMHVLPNGQVVRINSKTGVPQTLGNAAKPEEDEYKKAYDKGNADDAIALNKKMSDAAATAMANQSDYAMLGKALQNPDVGQGLAGPARNIMNKAYVAMGLGDAKTAAAAADGDIINALGPKMVLQILQNGGDKLLPGSMSDNDVKLGMRFGAGEKLEPEANRRLMAAAIKHNERTLEAEQFRQQVAEANGGMLPKDFRAQLGQLRSKWAAEDKARDEAAPAASPSTPQQTNTFKAKSGKTINWSY
jgi:hypothetical protein